MLAAIEPSLLDAKKIKSGLTMLYLELSKYAIPKESWLARDGSSRAPDALGRVGDPG